MSKGAPEKGMEILNPLPFSDREHVSFLDGFKPF
jgi:hypothetical protein